MADDSHFDAIIVGSGFGGSVAAYRLAEAGLRVCVLERGRSYPPESFPRRPRAMGRNFWDPSRGFYGMFDVWSFRGLEALVSSGLGGGSLIYANVLLRKDERWFVHESPIPGGYEHWPLGRAELDPHYDAVERMMKPQRYPLDAPGYSDTAKTKAMQEAAGRLGLEWGLPPLAVTFANPGRPPSVAEPIVEAEYPNMFGKTRTTCRLCGECDIGCNYGSKNTLDHTYLSAAKHHGADIRVLSEVRRLAPMPGGGYSVDYVRHDAAREGTPTKTAKLPLVTLTAPRLILGAGALGSPYLLMRNQSAFPHVSKALGTRFCGNGDLLGFMLPGRRPKGAESGARVLDPSRGPVITSYVRVPDEADEGGSGRGFYIEDAGFPTAVDWMLELATARSIANRVARFALRRLWGAVTHSPRSDLSAEMGNLIGSAELSSSSLPLLGMGRDVPDGVMSLRKGYLDIDWTTATSKAYFARVRQTMEDLSTELGTRFEANPLSLLKRVVTVHPLGGCPMGRHEGEGVVDAWGQAFNYPGLYVADGSALPGPVGANPSLTIGAFADRMAERILSEIGTGAGSTAARPPEHHRHEGEHVETAPTPGAAQPACTLEFTEEMKGWVTFGETDFEEGAKQGRKSKTFLMFHLTIEVDDVDRFVADPEHVASAGGWVECEELGGKLPVEKGVFNLFVDSADAGVTNMRYRLFFSDGAGHPLTLSGFKVIRDDPGFDLWSDTTTLYTKVLRGHVSADDEPGAEVSAAGIITIYMLDFAKQLTTLRVQGPSFGARRAALSDFGGLFLGKLWHMYAARAEANLRDGSSDA